MTLERIAIAASVALAMLAGVALMLPMQASAQASAAKCTFTVDLTTGTVSEEVRCLQKYLNGAGFTVSASGVGSAGSETSLFGDKTKAAVIKWQTAHGISPATGTFGPMSRAKFAALTGGAPAPTLPPQASDNAQQAVARAALMNAMKAYADAADDVGSDDGEAGDLLDDSRDALFDAFTAFMNGNYSDTITLSATARVRALDASNEADDSDDDDDEEDDDNDEDDDDEDEDEEDARDAVDEAQDDLDDAQDDIDDAEADGDDVGDAQDLLDEAQDAIDDAEDALDDEDWDDAMDFADDAQDLIDEALDEAGIDSDDDDDADDAIEDAEDAIDSLEDAIDEADADGEDTDDAEDALDEANDLLDEAYDAFDDEDWDDAIDLADEAREVAEDAEDDL